MGVHRDVSRLLAPKLSSFGLRIRADPRLLGMPSSSPFFISSVAQENRSVQAGPNLTIGQARKDMSSPTKGEGLRTRHRSGFEPFAPPACAFVAIAGTYLIAI